MFNKPLQDCLNLLPVSSNFYKALFSQILQGCGILKNISSQIFTMYIAYINNHATIHKINLNYPSKQKFAKFSSAISN